MIVVRDLYKSFGGHAVLEAVDLEIKSGESVVIIGRSGGGKSVLLKHLIGLLQPDQGTVLVEGENICGMNERQLIRVREKFGMVFQGAALFDSMTVAENVAFPLQRQGKHTPGEINRLVARTPMQGLYLCGACTHPGGSVIGINGRNAAMAVLKDKS